MSNNKTLVYLLGAVVVLLAVIAGVLIFNGQSASTVPDPTIATQPTSATGTGTPTTMPSTAPSGPFDPAKAPKVPSGQTPQDYVAGYFKAIVGGDYAKAYKMLPLDKQQAQTQETFAATLKGYGMTGSKMGKVTTSGNDTIVEATAVTGSGDFGYTWTFTKYNGGLVVKSRVLSGMGTP